MSTETIINYVINGNLSALKKIHNVSLNTIVNDLGQNLIIIAILSTNISNSALKFEIIKYLIKENVNINQQENNFNTAIFYAVSSLNKNLVKLLIKYGCNLKTPNRHNNLPLTHICYIPSIKLSNIINPYNKLLSEDSFYSDIDGNTKDVLETIITELRSNKNLEMIENIISEQNFSLHLLFYEQLVLSRILANNNLYNFSTDTENVQKELNLILQREMDTRLQIQQLTPYQTNVSNKQQICQYISTQIFTTLQDLIDNVSNLHNVDFKDQSFILPLEEIRTLLFKRDIIPPTATHFSLNLGTNTFNFTFKNYYIENNQFSIKNITDQKPEDISSNLIKYDSLITHNKAFLPLYPVINSQASYFIEGDVTYTLDKNDIPTNITNIQYIYDTLITKFTVEHLKTSITKHFGETRSPKGDKILKLLKDVETKGGNLFEIYWLLCVNLLKNDTDTEDIYPWNPRLKIIYDFLERYSRNPTIRLDVDFENKYFPSKLIFDSSGNKYFRRDTCP